jgi:choline transport protein
LSYISGTLVSSFRNYGLTEWQGWLTAIGWQMYLASVCFLVGTIIQGLIVLNTPVSQQATFESFGTHGGVLTYHQDYVYERWHGTLLSIAIVFFCVSFVTFLASSLPYIGKKTIRDVGVVD